MYQEIALLRPQWFEVKEAEYGTTFTDDEKELAIKAGKLGKAIEKINLVISRGKVCPKQIYDLLGNKDYRKDLERDSDIQHNC